MTYVQPGMTSDESFAVFYEERRSTAYRQARKLVGSHEVAEDIVAEAFSRLWNRWNGDAVKEPSHYLARMVHNACMDHFRRLARDREAVSRLAGDLAGCGPGITDVEAREIVGVLLGKIPTAQRRTVSLRYLQDLSEARTAEVLGVAVGTVKSSAARGLHRLRRLSGVGSAD